MTGDAKTSIVVIGAGIIGCATAFYLSEHASTEGSTVHLIESSPELFASASGKAGGFIASDWFGPSDAALGALSFRLHKELADRFHGPRNWGYSRSTGISLLEPDELETEADLDWAASGESRAKALGIHNFHRGEVGPQWLRNRHGDKVTRIERGDVAQVDPLRLSQFLLKQSIANGVKFHHPAQATGIRTDTNGQASTISINSANGEESEVPCTHLLITAGSWSPAVFRTLFPESKFHIPISSLAGHHIFKSPQWTFEYESKGCHAVFTTTRNGFSPIMISRIGEELYFGGLNDLDTPLPATPMDVLADPKCIEELKRVAGNFLGQDGTDVSALEILREGLCFRPITRRGVAMICRISDGRLGTGVGMGISGGVYLAAGHGPWGISLSLGTGKVMAEMLQGKKTSADVGALGLQ